MYIDDAMVSGLINGVAVSQKILGFTECVHVYTGVDGESSEVKLFTLREPAYVMVVLKVVRMSV